MSLSFTPAAIVLVVEDDGVGFDAGQLSEIGFGLSGMRKRAERIGANLTIDSVPGNGFQDPVGVAGPGAPSQLTGILFDQ